MSAMDTIYALSSGGLPSGVAVVRISGSKTRFVLETMFGRVPEARKAVLGRICNPETGEVIDQGLCLWFPGPASFTGQDCAEFQVHGGPAVVRALLEAIGSVEGTRLADPGEFSRRAFTNGKLDLTEIEGLSDLIGAETELQRKQALDLAGGLLREKLEGWRTRIVRMRAMIEAELDFSAEEDVPDDASVQVWEDARSLAREIREALDDGRRGEIIREGFQVVLMGAPNAGKSSLLNALARREAAIVTDEPGTTRDLIEVKLDLDGYPVVLVDTAGLRETQGKVELEGMRRARERAADADLVIWLLPVDEALDNNAPPMIGTEVILVRSKDDGGIHGDDGISVERPGGLDGLIARVGQRVSSRTSVTGSALISRARHRESLLACVEALESSLGSDELVIEVRSELVRQAGDHIARITGRIETEHLLDVIFREFCVGK